jgi:hypothetical protein
MPLQKGLSKKAFAKGSFQEGMQKGLAMKAFAKGAFPKLQLQRCHTNKAFVKKPMPLQQGSEAAQFQPHNRVWPTHL